MGSVNKNNYLSTVKAIGIILMVVGHSGCPEYLDRLIYYFHMPLFFFVSGYFLRLEEGVKEFVVKRINSLYVPYLKWSLFFLILHNVFFHAGIYNSSYGYEGHAFYEYDFGEFLKRFLYVTFTMDRHEPLLGGFWFLKTLLLSAIFCKVLLSIFDRFFLKKTVGISLLVNLLLLLISKYYSLEFPYIGNLSIIFMGSVFYLTGYIYHCVEKGPFYKWHWLTSSGIVLLVFTHNFHSMSMYCNFDDVLFYIFIALIGIYCSIGFCYNLEKCGIGLYIIGKSTMQILALHFIAFKIVSIGVILYYILPFERLSELPVVFYHQELTWLLYSLVGIMVPLLVKIGYDKLKTSLL